jgi:hypothetical protein
MPISTGRAAYIILAVLAAGCAPAVRARCADTGC